LGSHLCEKLLDEGHEVICLDNFLSGRKDNIRHLLSNPKFELIRHDVQQPIHLHVEQIYHLACPASPIFYQFSAIDTMKTSVYGTINLLELARNCKATFLLASTSEIYGDPLVHPQVETYWGNVNTIGIRSCYDEGKRAAEAILLDYHRTYGVDVKLARIFNSYGPRMFQDDGRVVSNFVVQALQNENITIYGDGSQTRSFCYCKDTIDGLYALMNSPYLGPFNIGMPIEATVRQLAESVVRLVGETKSQIIYHPLPSDDPTRRQPDISRARALLNWSPKVSLETGLTNTIEYFRTKLATPDAENSPEKQELIRQQTRVREQQERERKLQLKREEELVKAFLEAEAAKGNQ